MWLRRAANLGEKSGEGGIQVVRRNLSNHPGQTALHRCIRPLLDNDYDDYDDCDDYYQYYYTLRIANLILQLRLDVLMSHPSSLRPRREEPVRSSKDSEDEDVSCKYTTNK